MDNFGYKLLENREHESSSSSEEMTYEEIFSHVKNSNISTELLRLSKKYTYYMRNRKLTSAEFRECLEVYWNNQDFYVQYEDSKSLTELEIWFLHVIEPTKNLKLISHIEDWLERENKKNTLRTHYCSKEARKLIRMKRNNVVQALVDLRLSRLLAKELIRKKSRKGKSSDQ